MTTMDTPGADRAPGAELHARIEQTAAREGFFDALDRHLGEIVRTCHAGGWRPDLLGAGLLRWMAADPELAPVAASAAARMSAAAGREAAALEAGAPPDSVCHDDFVRWAAGLLREHAAPHPDVREGDGTPMLAVSHQVFRNWGRTVQNDPAWTFIPRTRAGVCNLVKWAETQGKRVRASGYRHSWSDIFSADGQVLVSTLPLGLVEDLPARHPAIDPANELQGIQVVGTVREGGVTKALCRIGAGTTNEQFRRWCLDPQGGDLQWTVPFNVIMVEITWGGSNAPICHGAGWRHTTLSDLVHEIEFVNARGELQTVNDPALLAAAAGCFGLLGIVTAVTLKLDPMTYARLQPVKKPVVLTIPPPEGVVVPGGVALPGVTREQLDEAWTDFVRRCETDYYSEWFWFPYQTECWINTWQNDGDPAQSVDYPSPWETCVQEMQEYLAQLANEYVFPSLPGWVQAKVLGAAAQSFMPGSGTTVTPLIDALHFRRGIQNMRVLDVELEIPIPARADDPGRPDWTVCQKAWWAALTAVYDSDGAPVRIALEMRVTAGSQVLMAPQHGNRLGTCSIEVLTTLDTSPEEWNTFRQRVVDAWCALTDADGRPLNTRPHWAKQWQGLTVRGQAMEDYLRDVAYAERIPEFGAALARVAGAGGYGLSDMRRRFSNPLLDRLFADILP